MKRIVILLSIIILAKITSFSANTSIETNQDSTVLITSKQLKYANLIFVEHEFLLKENKLLNQQIVNLNKKNNLFLQADSLKTKQLKEYEQLENTRLLQIQDMNRDLKQKNQAIKGWTIGCVSVSIALVLFLILK